MRTKLQFEHREHRTELMAEWSIYVELFFVRSVVGLAKFPFQFIDHNLQSS